VDNTFKGHRGADSKAGTQRIVMPDDDGQPSFVIPLWLLAALMTFKILLPTDHDLDTLPIVDITSSGLWVPSDFNENDHGLIFADPLFEPARVAQNTAKTNTTESPDSRRWTDCRRTEGQQHQESVPIHACPTSFPTPKPPTPGECMYFFDARDDLDLHSPRYYDPSDNIANVGTDFKAFHLSIDYDKVLDSGEVDHFLSQLDFTELRGDKEEFDTFAYASRVSIQDQAEKYVEYLGYRPVDIIRKTLENTSQLATTIL
jgi:hypothetical protein